MCAPAYSGQRLCPARRELERHDRRPLQLIPVCAGLPGGRGRVGGRIVLAQQCWDKGKWVFSLSYFGLCLTTFILMAFVLCFP